MNKQAVVEVGAIGTGALAAFGHFCAMIEPILADLSYAAAFVVGVLTAWKMFRNRDK
jgi:hypothetical protein